MPEAKSFADLEIAPPTVTDHIERPSGYTLVTIDPNEDRNIEVYDGDQQKHFSGDSPGEN